MGSAVTFRNRAGDLIAIDGSKTLKDLVAAGVTHISLIPHGKPIPEGAWVSTSDAFLKTERFMKTRTSKLKRANKPKGKSARPIIKQLTEERILQLSNDLSEDIRSGDVREWRNNQLMEVRMHVAGFTIAYQMLGVAAADLGKWNDARCEEEKRQRKDGK